MTSQKFIEAVESIYGSYQRKALRGMVLTKVKTLTDTQRADLFNQLVETYSTRFGTQPDVVAINEALAELDTTPQNGTHKDAHGNLIVYRDGVAHRPHGRRAPDRATASHRSTRAMTAKHRPPKPKPAGSSTRCSSR